MADEPLEALQGQTPLEYAHTPHMDDVVRLGSIGQFYAIEPGVKVDSDAAHLAMLGQDVNLSSSNRGAYEALGAGLTLGPADVGFRVNFATIDNQFVPSTAEREGLEMKQRNSNTLSMTRWNLTLSHSISGKLLASRALSCYVTTVSALT